MGIPRLRMPRSAPSRATLKLEEAWHHFISAEEWDQRLPPGMRSVDLGAAPGGWTWQLAQRGMFVEAIDNGSMDQALMDSGQVSIPSPMVLFMNPKSQWIGWCAT
jgi:23S rRNA (cytidine2498-2'-O)-methyltransferase